MMGLRPRALLLVLPGCALPADVVILLPDENGTVGKLVVHEGGSTAELDKPLTAVDPGSEASLRNVFTTQRPAVDSDFARALDAAPPTPLPYLLQFPPDFPQLPPPPLP